MEKVYLVETYFKRRMNDQIVIDGFRKIYRTAEEAFKFAKARVEYYTGGNDTLPEDAKLQDGLFVYEFEHEFQDTIPYAEISIEEFEVHEVEDA